LGFVGTAQEKLACRIHIFVSMKDSGPSWCQLWSLNKHQKGIFPLFLFYPTCMWENLDAEVLFSVFIIHFLFTILLFSRTKNTEICHTEVLYYIVAKLIILYPVFPLKLLASLSQVLVDEILLIKGASLLDQRR
jgi:hypothetical protein